MMNFRRWWLLDLPTKTMAQDGTYLAYSVRPDPRMHSIEVVEARQFFDEIERLDKKLQETQAQCWCLTELLKAKEMDPDKYGKAIRMLKIVAFSTVPGKAKLCQVLLNELGEKDKTIINGKTIKLTGDL